MWRKLKIWTLLAFVSKIGEKSYYFDKIKNKYNKKLWNKYKIQSK